MVKPSCYDRLQVKHTLSTNVSHNATAFPKKTGFKKCGKNCRTIGRINQRADVVHNIFSTEEEELVIKLHATIGSRWSIIAQQLHERTDDDVKNLWNTKLKKKLSAMGIDPITHRPYSQILADYGNIGCVTNNNYFQKDDTRNTQFEYLGKTPFIPYSQESSSSSSSEIKLLSNDHDRFSMPRYDQDHSVELLSQLQAINTVTQASIETSNYYKKNSATIDIHYPHQSSESAHQPADAAKSLTSPQFCWRDYLSADTFLPAYIAEENNEKQAHEAIAFAAEEEKRSNSFEGSSSCSFVRDMIERENEIFSETQDMILEEPFYY